MIVFRYVKGFAVRIIAKRTLREFWEQPDRADSKVPLESWHAVAIRADWSKPADVKADFRHASIVAGNRVVFNIAGNKYRLVVKFNYPYRIGYVRFIGTHREYDQIDVETI